MGSRWIEALLFPFYFCRSTCQLEEETYTFYTASEEIQSLSDAAVSPQHRQTLHIFLDPMVSPSGSLNFPAHLVYTLARWENSILRILCNQVIVQDYISGLNIIWGERLKAFLEATVCHRGQ